MSLWLILFTFLVSFSITYLVRLIALKKNKLDIPNHRSSHKIPTPSGGGLGVVIGFYLALIFLWFNQYLETQYFIAILGIIVVVIVGFIDDYRPISAKFRLLIHFISALWICYFIGCLDYEALSITWWQIALSITSIVYLVWLLNLYNFMDGIDGLAGVQGITVCLGAMAILISNNQTNHIPLLAVLSASLLGFLVWNWPPAKIFMGDVASGFIGILIGAISLITSQEQTLSLFTWLILMAVFISDATMTLISRLFNGENIVQSHNSHAYQVLSRQYGHKKVTMAIGIVNIVWLLPLAYTVQQELKSAEFILLTAYLPLIIIILNLRKHNSV